MSGEMMEYPKTPEEFCNRYSFTDVDEVYTNGSRLIPVFRVEQMVGHYFLDENAKLREENVRLRSCLSDDAENARMIMGENAKLRELVRDMWTWKDALPFGMRAVMRGRMRELGVE